MRKTARRGAEPVPSGPHATFPGKILARCLLTGAAATLLTACTAGLVPSGGDVRNALEDVANQIGMNGVGLSPIQIKAFHAGAKRTVVLGCKPDADAASAAGLLALCDLANPSDRSTDTFQLRKQGGHWYFTNYTQVARWETQVGASPE